MSEKIICIIEDNLPIRKLFSTLLQKSSYEVHAFDNASDGINWLKENKPSLILLDILLPDINGSDAIKIIRSIEGFDKVPVIAITGFASDVDKDMCLSGGFNHFMTKPINVATFVSDISKFVK